MTTTHPFGNQLLIRQIDSRREIGGIIIPDSFVNVSQECEVLAVGEGSWNRETDIFEPMEIKAGQHILVGRWGPREVTLSKEDIRYVVNLNEVIGTLSEGPPAENWHERLNLLHNHVLIEWEKQTKAAAKGILRPATYSEMQFTGIVLQIGPDVNLDKFPVKVGDRVFFDQFGDHFRKKNWKEGRYAEEKRYACLIDDDLRLTNLPERVEFEIVGDPA